MSWNDLRKGRFSQSGGEYFITFVCRNRARFFDDDSAARTFCQQLVFSEQRFGCVWKTWVLMPDHFHGLLQLGEGSLGQTLKHLKGLSAKRVNDCLGTKGGLWQPSYFDRGLRAEEDRKAIARYIVANPIRAGLVDNVRSYSYWNSVYL